MSDPIMINGYQVERLSQLNLGALEQIYRAVYNRVNPAGYYSRKYDTAYTGVQYVGYVAFDGKKNPVAYYGVIPCFIRYDDQLHLGAQSADTMTHPNHQYKGLFVKLANLTFDLCREEGIHIIWGLPNQNSLHAFLAKLQWQVTEILDVYRVRTGLISVDGLSRKVPLLRRAYQKYRNYILKRYLLPKAEVENSVFNDGFAGINRNARYLNYKTYNDTHMIKIGDASLWIKIKGDLIIGDINCRDEDFDDMMAGLKKIARQLGLKHIQFHTSQQTRLSALFSSRYDASPSFCVIFKDLGTRIPFNQVKLTYADVDTF